MYELLCASIIESISFWTFFAVAEFLARSYYGLASDEGKNASDFALGFMIANLIFSATAFICAICVSDSLILTIALLHILLAIVIIAFKINEKLTGCYYF